MAHKIKNGPQEEEYRIEILGRNVFVTDAMKAYAVEKLGKIDRLHTHIMDIHVTMDIQHLDHSVVIVLKNTHFKIKVEAESTDMYASIDKAVDKLQAQLRRWKDKIQDHHRKKINMKDLQVSILERSYDSLSEINEEIESANKRAALEAYKPHKVIGTDTRVLKMLNLDEAVMKMELSGDPFLLFKGEEDKKLKVLYRRSDGHFGLIIPE